MAWPLQMKQPSVGFKQAVLRNLNAGIEASGFSTTSSEWVNIRTEHLGESERGWEHVRQSGTYWSSLWETGFSQPSLWIRGQERTTLHSHLSSLIIRRSAFFRDGPCGGCTGTSVPFRLNDTCPCDTGTWGRLGNVSRVEPYGVFYQGSWCVFTKWNIFKPLVLK